MSYKTENTHKHTHIFSPLVLRKNRYIVIATLSFVHAFCECVSATKISFVSKFAFYAYLITILLYIMLSKSLAQNVIKCKLVILVILILFGSCWIGPGYYY